MKKKINIQENLERIDNMFRRAFLMIEQIESQLKLAKLNELNERITGLEQFPEYARWKQKTQYDRNLFIAKWEAASALKTMLEDFPDERRAMVGKIKEVLPMQGTVEQSYDPNVMALRILQQITGEG